MKATAPRCKLAVALQVIAQAFGYRQNPLTYRQAGEDMVRQMRCGLGHAAGAALGADAAAFTGRKATKKSSPQSSQRTRAKPWAKMPYPRYLRNVFSTGYIGGRGVVITLAVGLSGTCQLQPGLEVLGNRAVQEGALGWRACETRLDVIKPRSPRGDCAASY